MSGEQPTRRALLTLLVMPNPKIVKPAGRPPNLALFVLDDLRHEGRMAEVQLWIEEGYTLQDVVRQMAADLQTCRETGKA